MADYSNKAVRLGMLRFATAEIGPGKCSFSLRRIVAMSEKSWNIEHTEIENPT